MPNPLLYDGRLEKYIWISEQCEAHQNAQCLFGYLMRKNIYINGFATRSSSIVDLRMYNKRIYELSSLPREGVVVFYDILVGDIWKNYKDKGQRARVINPNMDRERVVIWGSGITGEKVYRLLDEAGIKVLFFVDSNESVIGTVKCGIPICSPNVLEKDFTIIEATEKWEKIDENIQTMYPKRFHFSLNTIWNQITCNFEGDEKVIVDISDFWMFSRFASKRIYIYGVSVIEMTFAKCLELLDYEIGGFLSDDVVEIENDEYPIIRVEDILYEENFYVWVYGKDKSKKLNDLGLRHYFEYESAFNTYGLLTEAKWCMDVNLGHSYCEDDKYPGFCVYGTEKGNNYKIVVLGGSATDGTMFPFKSWPEILYEELNTLCGEGEVTVYNGGVNGYASGQELVKLIRDVLPLKPDMLIVYDGFSELTEDISHPFSFLYSKKVFNYAAAYLEENMIGNCKRSVELGLQSKRNLYNNWLFCIRNMYAISKENNISFFSFCQPDLSSKKEKTTREKNMLLSVPNGCMVARMEKGLRQFMEKTQGVFNYIYDLSHIFDAQENIYMDKCHVWEVGNKIIAEKVEQIILPEIQKRWL